MSEQTADTAEQAVSSSDSNGLALDLAMEAARNDPSLRDEVSAFLADQRKMMADQRHHLHEQLKQLHLGIFEKWLGVLLRLATLCVGIAAATGAVMMVRDAANSRGLIIEPFSVPPDLAARGLTGQAVASQVLDTLTELQNHTNSFRPPQSYSNNWGSDLKVEIPETGISLGELRHFLREWLGSDTHITGEVWRTGTGIAIIARAGGERGEPVFGTEEDLGNVIRKTAENVYRATQPYRYANYLDRFYYDVAPVPADAKARLDQAQAIYRRLTYDPNPLERAWAWNALGTQAWAGRGDAGAAIAYYRTALSIVPDHPTWLSALVQWTWEYGHAAESLAAAERYVKVFPENRAQQIRMASYKGDYAEAARIAALSRANPANPTGYDIGNWNLGVALASQHDAEGARRVLGEPLRFPSLYNRTFRARNAVLTLAALQDWQAVLTREPAAEQEMRATQVGWDFDSHFNRIMRPWLALAKAHLGDIAGGQSLIATTPLDCYDCVRVRGQIAAIAGVQADTWFARAIHDGPSLPFAYHDWGRWLLARGKSDEAIVQFTIANQRGPKFADPLEGWGEALMMKNQSHLALAKFVEAEKFAPNWGRLHMKWGEALAYVGKKEDAAKHFARAAQLYLTTSEKSELAKAPHG